MMKSHCLVILSLVVLVGACGDGRRSSERRPGTGNQDTGSALQDAATGPVDAGALTDSGVTGGTDAGADGGADSGATGGTDAGVDGGAADAAADAGAADGGTPIDSGVGADAGGVDAAMPMCSSDAAMAGRIRVMSGTNTFDIPVTTNTTGTVRLTHKLDVDPTEGGCISEYEFGVRFHPNGCRFNMALGSTSQGHLLIRDIEVLADSFCLGFPDPIEGQYDEPYNRANSVIRRELRPIGNNRVTHGDMFVSCEPQQTYQFADEWVRLRRGTSRQFQPELWVNLSDLEFSGRFESDGDTSASCPAQTPVNDGWFDSGDGWRTSTPFCTPDYLFRDVNDQVCVRTPLFGSATSVFTLAELPGYAQQRYNGALSNTVALEFDAVLGTSYEIMAFRQDPSRLIGITCQHGSQIAAGQLSITDPSGTQIMVNRERLLLDGCDPYVFTPPASGRYGARVTINVQSPSYAQDTLAVRIRPM